MVERGKRTLKAKLLQIIISTMMLTGVVNLGAFAWTNYIVERSRLLETETQIREGISGKAATLAASHALALRGPVQDNAFGDVRQVVASAVNQDTDLVYGLFLSAGGETWAYVSPSHPEVGPSDSQPVNAAAELGIRTDGSSRPLSHRTLRMFGHEILEWSAAVVAEDGARLGTIIYGFSNERTHAAVVAAEQRSRAALLKAFITCTAIALLSLLFGIVWMSRSAARITEPLAELTTAANKIAAGERGLRVQIRSSDEVRDLAAAFNQMLEANEDAMRKLEVTTERALAADRLKSEFLANMSHEIRTPMNGVLGMVKLMRTMRLDGKLRRYVDTIDSAANSLLTIINDVLDFSKMEAGKYTMVSVPFQPHLVVQEVAELLAGRAHEKHLAFIHRTSADLPEVVIGDPDRFRQVLNNLVGNAIKFTERGEVFIDVDVAESNEETVRVRVAVHDTGIGIDPKDMPKLYDAFSQVDGTAVRRYGGTGLGLAISKRLVTMMGGEIEARSTPGQGSVFTFTARFGVSDASVASSSSVGPRNLRVLVVDDNRRWRDVIQEHLRAWEMHGESRETAAEALAALKQANARGEPFDAAVLSAELVGMSAAEMVHAVRAEPALRTLPLILLSSAPLSGMNAEIQAELTAQLQKPLRFSDLYNSLTGKLSAKVPLHEPRESLAPIPLPVSAKLVLVVDDNEINRFVVVEELTRRGYRTEEAANGREAVEKFRTGDYLCVLMDCQMPVLDGYDATRAIRKIEADEQRARTPVIALTAHALVGERERVLAVGMDDFLSKPFRPTSLEKLLRLHTRESNTKTHAAERPAVRPDLDLTVKRSEKLIRLFLANVPAQLDRLDEAIRAADDASVRALAHKLKGSCLALAAEGMSKTAEVLQHRAEASDLRACSGHLAELRRQYGVVASLLAKELVDYQRGSLETAKA